MDQEPAVSSAAMIAKEITAAPAMAKATGKPDRMPAKQRQEDDDDADFDAIESEKHVRKFLESESLG